MTKEEKVQVVKDLSAKLSTCRSYYIADSSDLSVDAINKFRRTCFEKGLTYGIYKNTLIKKALDDQDVDCSELDSVLKGTSGIIFGQDTPANAPAKAIKEFRAKGFDKPLFKGAYVDSDIFIGEEHLNTLSDLKSKEELVGEIIGLLQSPAKNVISALQSGGDTLSGLIKTLSEKSE